MFLESIQREKRNYHLFVSYVENILVQHSFILLLERVLHVSFQLLLQSNFYCKWLRLILCPALGVAVELRISQLA